MTLNTYFACYVMILVSSAVFFFKLTFKTKKNHERVQGIRVSNGLDPDHDRHSVSPDLGPNYLQGYQEDDT